MRILIAEDEVELARGLKFLLEKNKFSADIVNNGKDALDYFHSSKYDAVVLDIMMPGMDGMEVLQRIRKEKSGVPIMMLTAKAEIEDRVAGLEAGADDYLPKPFATREFIARVKALVRRNGSYTDHILSFGNVKLDCNRYELSAGEKSVRLNNKEFQLMELFLGHPHLVFSSEHIMDKVWGQDSEAGMDVVWTYVGFVRRKLKQLGADIEIRTVRGAGYSLEEIKC
ncbi:MAG: response regulator transcription factor [Fusicatenibacter sp.]